jgi:hypothetical protein
MKSSQKLHLAKLAEWSVRFQEQAASGLSIKDWCSQNGVSLYAYQYWKRIAKEAYLDSLIPEIVQVPEPALPASSDQLTALPSATPPVGLSTCSNSRDLYNLSDSRGSDSLRSPQSVLLSIGDIRIEFGATSTDEDIFRILKAVRHA